MADVAERPLACPGLDRCRGAGYARPMSARAIALRAHARALVVLGLPLAGSQLAQMALHVTDTIMLGWHSVEALAAGVLGASSFFLVFTLGSGFAHAVMPLVAAALGRDDDAQVRRDTRMGLWLSAGFGVLAYPLFWNARPILDALGQDPVVAGLAADYLRVAGIGLAPALGVMVLRAFLSSLERGHVVLWVTLAGVAINAALNWVLIFGNLGAPEMGVVGAAAASVGVQVAMLVLLAAYAARGRGLGRYAVLSRLWRADWAALRQVFHLGWPIGLTGLSEGGLFHASAIMMGWIGTTELAAHGIAIEVTAVAFMLHLGLSNAATVRVGRAEGAGDRAGLRDVSVAALGLSGGMACAIIALYLSLPEPIIRLFLNPADPRAPEIIAFGSVLIAFAALFQFFDAGQVMLLGLLRGLRDTRVPMVQTAISYWLVGIPASYLLAFPLGLGGAGLWLGLTVGLAVAACLLGLRLWRRLGAMGAVGTAPPLPARG